MVRARNNMDRLSWRWAGRHWRDCSSGSLHRGAIEKHMLVDHCHHRQHVRRHNRCSHCGPDYGRNRRQPESSTRPSREMPFSCCLPLQIPGSNDLARRHSAELRVGNAIVSLVVCMSLHRRQNRQNSTNRHRSENRCNTKALRGRPGLSSCRTSSRGGEKSCATPNSPDKLSS